MTFDMFDNGMKNKIFGHFSTANIVTNQIVDLGFKCLISLRNFLSQTIFLVPSINAQYSTSTKDGATVDWLFPH